MLNVKLIILTPNIRFQFLKINPLITKYSDKMVEFISIANSLFRIYRIIIKIRGI